MDITPYKFPVVFPLPETSDNTRQITIEGNTGPDAATHIAVIFDKGSHTFRNDLYDQYKANRDAMPEDLRPQMPLTREATRAFNIACEEIEGYEADDIIATLACQARESGGRVTIISSDKDLMQLVGGGSQHKRFYFCPQYIYSKWRFKK